MFLSVSTLAGGAERILLSRLGPAEAALMSGAYRSWNMVMLARQGPTSGEIRKTQLKILERREMRR